MSTKLIAAAMALCIGSAFAALADTVSVTKTCPAGGTCMASGSTIPLGRFRTTTPTFNWEALYTGTATQARRFWVSQSGANVATTELTTNAGDTQGTATVSPGVYFISIQTFAMGPGSYAVYGPGVHGDPHITTIDGINYDFQGAGEFVMLKHHDSYEVQTRMTPVATTGALPANPYTGLSTCVSVNTAAAVRLGNHRITYQPNISGQPDPSGLQLRVDGQLVTDRLDGRILSDGSRIWKNESTGELRIERRDHVGVRVIPHWWSSQNQWYLDVEMMPPPGTSGIAAEINADDWLPLLSDGNSLGPTPADLDDRYEALYVKFADSWRVTDASTLFDYAPGTSAKTYSMPAWPGRAGQCDLPFTVPVQGVDREVAVHACSAVHSPRLRQFCEFDVTVTGNRGFGRSYVVAQGIAETKQEVSANK